MNKVTTGDCAVILGRPWAIENGIRTAEDMKRPAPEEWAKLAQWVVAAQKSMAKGKEIVKATEAKQQKRGQLTIRKKIVR